MRINLLLFPVSIPSDRLSGHADGSDVSGQVTMDQRGSAHHAPSPNLAAGHHRRADADQCPCPNRDLAAQVYARRDMGVVTDPVMVVNGTAGVQNGISADYAASVHYHASTDHRTWPYLHIGSQNGAWVNGCGEAFTLLAQPFKGLAADHIVADGDDHGVVLYSGKVGKRP